MATEPLSVPRPPYERRSVFMRIVGIIKGIASIGMSFVKILIAIIGIFLLVSIISQLAVGSSKDAPTYQEVLYGDGLEKVAVIDLNGIILDSVQSGPFDYVTESMITPRKTLKILEAIKKDTTVKAVVLRINSPGGSVTASDEIYQTIKRFKKETNLPIIVSQGEIAASGGYYISLAGDTIISDTTTLTGSIGVIASMLNFQELANEYGVKEIAITSGKNKNFFSALDEMTEEETAIMQKLIDEAYAQFLSRIREEQPVSEATLTELADGRPLTGIQAHKAQLVDRLGNFHDSVEIAREAAGFPNAQVVEYTDQGVFESLFGAVSKPLMNKLSIPVLNSHTELRGKPAYLYGGM